MGYSKTISYILVVSVIVVVSLWSKQHWQQTIQPAKIAVLDVGQGQAIYCRTANGDDVLINGGPDRVILERLGEQLPYWDKTLELVILTDTALEHITGLLTLLDYYHITQIWLPPNTQSHNIVYQTLLQQLASHHVVVQYKTIAAYQVGSHSITFANNITMIDQQQAVISGTPQYETMQQLKDMKVARTDQQGTVERSLVD